jgi:hypothetical protein
MSLRIHDSEWGNELLIVIIHANYLTGEIYTFYNFARFVAPVSASVSNGVDIGETVGSGRHQRLETAGTFI